MVDVARGEAFLVAYLERSPNSETIQSKFDEVIVRNCGLRSAASNVRRRARARVSQASTDVQLLC